MDSGCICTETKPSAHNDVSGKEVQLWIANWASNEVGDEFSIR